MAGLFLMVIGCEKDALTEWDQTIAKKEQVVIDNNAVVGTRAFEPEVEAMIDRGVDYLLSTQVDNQASPYYGAFGEGTAYFNNEKVALTGMAITKLCDRSIEKGFQPTDPDGPYYGAIMAGLEYLEGVGANNSYNGIPLYATYNHHANYQQAWSIMAFVATRDPAYKGLVTAAIPYFTDYQAANGGFGYEAPLNASWQDNSNTGYVALALVAARNFGVAIDDAVFEKMGDWAVYIQNANGGSGYDQPNSWVNTLKTGNLLFEFAMDGYVAADPEVQAAVSYIHSQWNVNNTDPGFRNNFQAMYTMMKGFTALGIEDVNGIDWYAEFMSIITATENNGTWSSPASFEDTYLSTVFALLTIEKVVELPVLAVEFDIKPTSCPNPFNMKSNGVLPVAILGTADFDVTEIDPATVVLEGVAPIQFNLEDVAAPAPDNPDPCYCVTDGPDGYMDMTFKFNHKALANVLALQGVVDGEVVEMTISGETIDGVAFTGVDCVVILKKGKK